MRDKSVIIQCGETEEELFANAKEHGIKEHGIKEHGIKEHGIKEHGYTEETWQEEISKNLEHFKNLIKQV
jgi:hypothetical protein